MSSGAPRRSSWSRTGLTAVNQRWRHQLCFMKTFECTFVSGRVDRCMALFLFVGVGTVCSGCHIAAVDTAAAAIADGAPMHHNAADRWDSTFQKIRVGKPAMTFALGSLLDLSVLAFLHHPDPYFNPKWPKAQPGSAVSSGAAAA